MATVTTYTDNFNAANSADLRTKLQVAIVDCANDVQAEDQTGLPIPAGADPVVITEQELHNRRSELAYNVLRDPQGFSKVFSYGVADNLDLYESGGAVFLASTDAWPTNTDLKNSVSALWTNYALNCNV